MYSINRLVYCESSAPPRDAIQRAKGLKKSNRARRIRVIKAVAPSWEELSQTARHITYRDSPCLDSPFPPSREAKVRVLPV